MDFSIFVPLAKADEAKRLISGLLTEEMPDRANEICDYVSSKPFFQKWSREVSEASGGKSLGNVRVMHAKLAVGKLTQIDFDDEGKKIEVIAKIVDADTWQKVTEGIYTGLSVGGRYARRWKDANSDFTRFTAEPSEISLVDRPCLPSATFEIRKASGLTERRRFDGERAERLARIRAEVDAETAPMTAMLAELLAKVEGLHLSYRTARCGTALADGDRLAPPRAAVRAVSKSEDSGIAALGRGPSLDEAMAAIDRLPNGERSLALMKIALGTPVTLDKIK